MSNKDPLSTYPLKKLLELWQRGELTKTQLLGHLLQHVISLEQRMTQAEKQRPTHRRRPDRNRAGVSDADERGFFVLIRVYPRPIFQQGGKTGSYF